MDEKRTASALRISPHYYNTREEIDTAVEALGELIAESRSPDRRRHLPRAPAPAPRHTVSAISRWPSAVGWIRPAG